MHLKKIICHGLQYGGKGNTFTNITPLPFGWFSFLHCYVLSVVNAENND